jgi:hypothetical protein
MTCKKGEERPCVLAPDGGNNGSGHRRGYPPEAVTSRCVALETWAHRRFAPGLRGVSMLCDLRCLPHAVTCSRMRGGTSSMVAEMASPPMSSLQ